MNIKSIIVIGRKWLDRKNNNTYFSAVGMVDGVVMAKITYAHGYDKEYEDNILQLLEDYEYIPPRRRFVGGLPECTSEYVQRINVHYFATAPYVSKKQDLFGWVSDPLAVE